MVHAEKIREQYADRVLSIVKKLGVSNIQEICRNLNNRDFKFCHSKFERYKEIDDRFDNQFVKQCNECMVHYRDMYHMIRWLEKEGKIFTDKRIYYDRINDDGDIRTNGPGRRRDHFRFCYVDPEEYRKRILVNTLDGYVES